MTESVTKIYYPFDSAKSFRKFLPNDVENDEFAMKLQEVFNELQPFFQKRWVPMNKGYCFDRTINACWLGLCENDFAYPEISTDKSLEEVVSYIQNYYQDNNIDLPTEDELRALHQIKEAPFALYNGRPKPGYNMFCKIKDGKTWVIKHIDLDNMRILTSSSSGFVHPIFRLYKDTKTKLSDKQIFLLWLKHKLKPRDFHGKVYDELMQIDFDINLENFEIQINSYQISYDNLVKKLKSIDKERANLPEYPEKIFYDVNKGSWEVYRRAFEIQDGYEIELDRPLVARNPEADIKDGIIAIDFGTKSTVVVKQDETEKILPLRVGMGNWNEKERPEHFENPTVMEFINLEKFLTDYKQYEYRPYTRWDDLTISHTAYNNLTNSSNAENFNAFLTELKQWSGNSEKKIKIEDQQKNLYEIKPFLELSDDDLNPIELYAYYLGLYINNQFNGVYVNYILSFPVTYEMSVRKKILESFKQGLKKSLPLKTEIEVISGASEPAAYAAVAIEKHGLAEKQEINFYGVFDFGGGTTDFDFGIFRWAREDEEMRYDYVIEHFGAGGDRFLGGENLLEMLAFEVFKANREILYENDISFTRPVEMEEFVGSEVLISDSREARLNMVNLVKKLRPFWERENFDDKIFEDDKIVVDLYSNDGELKSAIALEMKEEDLLELLKRRIQKGIDSFFEGMREAFFHNKDIVQKEEEITINILLAGNSSKSPLVRELFETKINEIKDKIEKEQFKGDFVLYDPLDNNGNYEEPNGKTGVAFGLIATRKGGNILVIDKNIKENEIKFQYYLGRKRRKKFRMVIDREEEYNRWKKFIDASTDWFEVYYTELSLATTNEMDISETKKRRLKIDYVDKNAFVYIRTVTPNEFEYVVSNDELIKEEKYLGEIKRVKI